MERLIYDDCIDFKTIANDLEVRTRDAGETRGQHAAIARCSGAAIGTRNVADFEGCGVEVLNPWDV